MGYLRNDECQSLQTFAIVFSTPENLLVEISGALGTQLSAKMCFEKMLQGILEFVNARACKPLPLCSASLETY